MYLKFIKELVDSINLQRIRDNKPILTLKIKVVQHFQIGLPVKSEGSYYKCDAYIDIDNNRIFTGTENGLQFYKDSTTAIENVSKHLIGLLTYYQLEIISNGKIKHE